MSELHADNGANEFDRGSRFVEKPAFSGVIKKKGISHFDCNSAVTLVSDALFAGANRESLSTGNVKTGASAAGSSAVMTAVSDSESRNLVLSVPNFWTDVGRDRTSETNELSLPTLSCDGLLLEHVCGEEMGDTELKRISFSELLLVRPELRYQKCVLPCRFEYMDHGARYYRQFFAEHEHQNFFGNDDQLGPIAVSLRREACSVGHSSNVDQEIANMNFMYRMIVRTPHVEVLRCCVLEDSIQVDGARPRPGCMPARDVLQYVVPKLPRGSLRLAQTGPKVVEKLQQLDEQTLSRTFKFGVIYCRAGQSTEEEMYNNQDGSESFTKFLSCIASRVTLKHFEGYRAQLDNRYNSTGTHSYYTCFHGNEIMFHVSTLLPFTKESRQQLQRKRHIGNDIVTVVFQEEGSKPFSPATVRSHFQHVFIVVREVSSKNGKPSYMVAVSAADSVPKFGPPLPADPIFAHGEHFREFLLTKLINAEGAGHRSTKFLTLTRRTRFEVMKNLSEDWTTQQTLDSTSSVAIFYGRWSNALKKKRPSSVRLATAGQVTRALPGGVCWPVEVISWGVHSVMTKATRCTLCLSPTYFCLVGVEKQAVLFCIQVGSIIGWTAATTSQTVTLYYNEGEFIKFHCIGSGDALVEIDDVIVRLSAVTNGCFAQEALLRRSPDGHLGFIIHAHGIVGEVDPYGVAWKSGLRQGARLLEINGVPVYGQPPQTFLSEIKSAEHLSTVIAPPTGSGTIRGQRLRGRWQQRTPFSTQSPHASRRHAFGLAKGTELPARNKASRVQSFDSSQLTLQKRRKDRCWGHIVTLRKAVPQSALKQDAKLQGVVEKAKRALAASGLSEAPSSRNSHASSPTLGSSQKSTSIGSLDTRLPLQQRPSTPISPFDRNWCGPVAVSEHQSLECLPRTQASQPAAVPFATCGFARPLQSTDSIQDLQDLLDTESVRSSDEVSFEELASRLHSAEREVARLQEELSNVHKENRSLVRVVSNLDRPLQRHLTSPHAPVKVVDSQWNW